MLPQSFNGIFPLFLRVQVSDGRTTLIFVIVNLN